MPQKELKEKIVEILSEYPSHPPMKGSELGINIITVDKILEVVLEKSIIEILAKEVK